MAGSETASPISRIHAPRARGRRLHPCPWRHREPRRADRAPRHRHQSQTLPWVVSLTIYGLALVATFSFSAGYHLVARPKLKESLRRLDHAAIFLMIAGTYTPFILIKMKRPWGFGLLAVVWTMAAIGIVIKLFAPRFLDGLVDRALPGAGLGRACGVGAADVGAAGRRADAAHDRRRALHHRRRVPSLGAAAVSERHLARLRAVGGELPFRGRDLPGRACKPLPAEKPKHSRREAPYKMAP